MRLRRRRMGDCDNDGDDDNQNDDDGRSQP